MGNGQSQVPRRGEERQKSGCLLCTHGHFDHIGDAVEIAKQHNPVVVAIPELAHWLGKKGVKQVAEMNKGGTQTVGDIKVTMVHADHSCGITDGDQIVYGGEACGYVIEFSNGVKIYHAGDTNIFGDMAIIRDLYAPRDCHDSDRRPLHHVTARSRVCLQSAEAEDGHPHALRNFPGADGHARADLQKLVPGVEIVGMTPGRNASHKVRSDVPITERQSMLLAHGRNHRRRRRRLPLLHCFLPATRC